jgi:lauroyl/myristoyl acyltransferase
MKVGKVENITFLSNEDFLPDASSSAVDKSAFWEKAVSSVFFHLDPHLRRAALRVLPRHSLTAYLRWHGSARCRFKKTTQTKCHRLLEEHLGIGSYTPLANRIVQDLFRNFEEWAVPPHEKYWEQTDRVTQFIGEEHLRECLREQRGVIFLSSHLGSWKYLRAVFKQRGLNADLYFPLGWPIKWDKSKASGTGFVLRAVKSLKRNRIIALMGDIAWGRAATFPFLATELDFPVGFATLSQHTGAPVLPGFCVSPKHGENHVILSAPIWPHQYPGTKEDQVLRMVGAYVKQLEAMVQAYPDNADKYFLGNRLTNGAKAPPESKIVRPTDAESDLLNTQSAA